MVGGPSEDRPSEQYKLSLSLPNVVTGKGHEIRFPSSATPPLCVPFDTDFGERADWRSGSSRQQRAWPDRV